jgi:hypothetical protein
MSTTTFNNETSTEIPDKTKLKPENPTNLDSYYQGPGVLKLTWSKPCNSGNSVEYLIERSELANDGRGYSLWKQIETCSVEKVILNRQPRGIELRYRVVASDSIGMSKPSNVVNAIL